MARQYVNYFAIKRNNEKNDVKLLPPNKDNRKSPQVLRCKICEVFLKILSKYAPDFLKQGLIKLFDLMGACSVSQNLEEK